MTGPPGAATAYDAVVYPTALFAQTAPDRMATIATLAGLDPPPVSNARVLEVAAGDGMNLIALAAAWPDAEFVGFDLAASAVARGRALIAAAGLTNIRLEVLDIVDAADRLDGHFDYIIVHGVYAWVPPDVRAATMALFGRLLSPNGVAYVSYNALPGGYLRMALRDALLFAVEDVEGDAARLDLARANLTFLAKPIEGETIPQAAMRFVAEATQRQPESVLHHDEMGAHFHPQALRDVADAARGAGLRFLGDAGNGNVHHAFLPDGLDDDADIVTVRQAEDYREVRFFRSTLLVRDAAQPARRLDRTAIDRLFAACSCVRTDATSFGNASGEFEVADPDLADALARLVAAWPARIRVAELGGGKAVRGALFELFDAGWIELHATAAQHAIAAGDRPRASPLARVMALADATMIPTLDHRLVPLDDSVRTVLTMLDGTRDRAALGLPGLADHAALDDVLNLLAGNALLLR